MNKACENFRGAIMEGLRRNLPVRWMDAKEEEGTASDATAPPSFPGGNDKALRAAILAAVYSGMSRRALSASGQIDPASSNLATAIKPAGARAGARPIWLAV